MKLLPKYFPRLMRGRFAKTMSFLVKHSSTADGDETTRTRRDPNWRRNTGPFRLDKFQRVLWSGFLRR